MDPAIPRQIQESALPPKVASTGQKLSVTVTGLALSPAPPLPSVPVFPYHFVASIPPSGRLRERRSICKQIARHSSLHLLPLFFLTPACRPFGPGRLPLLSTCFLIPVQS